MLKNVIGLAGFLVLLSFMSWRFVSIRSQDSGLSGVTSTLDERPPASSHVEGVLSHFSRSVSSLGSPSAKPVQSTHQPNKSAKDRYFNRSAGSPNGSSSRSVRQQEFTPLEEILAVYDVTDPAALTPQWAGQRSDEPFNVRAYIADRLLPGENAAPLYLKAMAQYCSKFVAHHPLHEQEAFLQRTTDFESRVFDYSEEDWLRNNANSAEVRQLLAEAQPYLDLIDQAQLIPDCVFMEGFIDGESVNYFGAATILGRLGIIEIAFHSSRGDFRLAEKAISRTFRLAQDIRLRGGHPAWGTTKILENVTNIAIRNFYLPQPGLTVTDCDQLLAILQHQRRNPVEDAREAIQGDYVFRGTMLADASSHNVVMGFVKEKYGHNDTSWEVLNKSNSLLLSADNLHDARRLYEEYVHSMIKDVNRERTGVSGAFKLLLSAVGLTSPPTSFDSSVLNTYVQFNDFSNLHQAHSRVILMAVAVKRYQLEHGELPETLEQAAVEAGFEGVLSDPFDGQPLRYVILDGQGIVYSIGPDLKDDGGAVDRIYGKHFGDILFRIP